MKTLVQNSTAGPARRQRQWLHYFCLPCLAGVLYGGVMAAARAQQPVAFGALHDFGSYPGADGSRPQWPLVLGQRNILYGTTQLGGTNNSGTIFKLNLDGSGYAVIYNFNQAQSVSLPPPANPAGAPLVQDAGGALYGTTYGGGANSDGTVFKLNTDGSGFTVLHSFANTDGGPLSLMQGSDGALYGTSYSAVFKLDMDGGNYQVLHPTFAAFGKLIQDAGGALYGTTYIGGPNSDGTVFKLNADGSGFTVLHGFPAFAGDGTQPWAGLIQGGDGALYGTTATGGTNGAGTVFSLNPDGSGYQVLHNFLTNGLDGQTPYGALVEGLGNKLYGTTLTGGTNGTGTIFEMDLGGGGYTLLYHFASASSTKYFGPNAGLVQGPASNGSGVLYGTTVAGGGDEAGGVFGFVVNPPLTITPAVSQSGGSEPVVVWPAWALNYVLQTTTNLGSGNWTTATNGLPMTGLQLTNTAAPNAYYRLILQ